jgi:ketosteroid isomerase-like protein
MSKSLEARLQALEDREEIARLKARYCQLNDGGWNGPTHAQVDEVVDLFVDDAVWDGGPVAGKAVGKENIRALFTAFQVVPFVIHNVMNPIIDIDGDTATGNWHAIIPGTDAQKQALWTFGLYKETYVRTPQGWRFSSVTFEPAANAPYEQGWGKSQFFTAARPFGSHL